MTNASGVYSLELPIGTYTLHATANGCTESADAEVTGSTGGETVVQDFVLFRKLDDFGHACAPIDFDWVETHRPDRAVRRRLRRPPAPALRLHVLRRDVLAGLPLRQRLHQLRAPDQFNAFPTAIPSPLLPNAAIYPLWQDLRIDAASSIGYELVGTAPDRAFVISYDDVKASGASSPISFEVKLWENGAIDLLYGANAANPGDGRNATDRHRERDRHRRAPDRLPRGRSSAPTGPSASARSRRASSRGVVTDSNTGEPIAGATVTATAGRPLGHGPMTPARTGSGYSPGSTP